MLRVIGQIMVAIKGLQKDPERHEPYKYRLENDDSFWAIEIYKYRIIYTFLMMKFVYYASGILK